MTLTETKIEVLRFLKTRPDGTGAKFSEICRCVMSNRDSIYDALYDMTDCDVLVCDMTKIPRTWRIADVNDRLADCIFNDPAFSGKER